LAYETLPVMDGALWSGTERAGIWPVVLSADGESSPMSPDGPPVAAELNRTDLSIQQPLKGGGSFSIVCRETGITCSGVDTQGKPLNWAWDLTGGDQQKSAVQKVTTDSVVYHYNGTSYQLRLAPDGGSCQPLINGGIRLTPDRSGKLVLILGGS
jgi:hypothetical protein